jgi:2-polyprenyl-3-methyl-5-hydroxy-6-metoxy-1,4-benzoquinol methylase
MLEYITGRPQTVLELGCGDGGVGAVLKKRFGCRAIGIEVSESAAEKARVNLDQVYVANIETMDLAELGGTFDLIIANDVLEHLIDPWAAVSRLRPLLNDGGKFVASMPNIRCYKALFKLVFKAEWQYCDAGILDRTHLRFFTKSSMRALFEDNGYRIETLEGLRPPRIRHIWKWLQYQLYPDLLTVQYAVVAVPRNVAPEGVR